MWLTWHVLLIILSFNHHYWFKKWNTPFRAFLATSSGHHMSSLLLSIKTWWSLCLQWSFFIMKHKHEDKTNTLRMTGSRYIKTVSDGIFEKLNQSQNTCSIHNGFVKLFFKKAWNGFHNMIPTTMIILLFKLNKYISIY